mmetsp:Transcript_12039/g.14334  ORF Transcript_12039/g.14334 Transcript_12039/m.14334 type:complete len:88 (-) Transcript_12039:374-637(-)
MSDRSQPCHPTQYRHFDLARDPRSKLGYQPRLLPAKVVVSNDPGSEVVVVLGSASLERRWVLVDWRRLHLRELLPAALTEEFEDLPS